jgi:hypothetical protein
VLTLLWVSSAGPDFSSVGWTGYFGSACRKIHSRLRFSFHIDLL